MTALHGARDQNALGFNYAIGGDTIRHQRNLSLGVIIVLAIAIMTAMLSLDVRPLSPPSQTVSLRSVTQHAERAAVPSVRS